MVFCSSVIVAAVRGGEAFATGADFAALDVDFFAAEAVAGVDLCFAGPG